MWHSSINIFLMLRFGSVDKIKTANRTKPCSWVTKWSEYIQITIFCSFGLSWFGLRFFLLDWFGFEHPCVQPLYDNFLITLIFLLCFYSLSSLFFSLSLSLFIYFNRLKLKDKKKKIITNVVSNNCSNITTLLLIPSDPFYRTI